MIFHIYLGPGNGFKNSQYFIYIDWIQGRSIKGLENVRVLEIEKNIIFWLKKTLTYFFKEKLKIKIIISFYSGEVGNLKIYGVLWEIEIAPIEFIFLNIFFFYNLQKLKI